MTDRSIETMRFLFAYYFQTRDSDVQAVATAKVPNDHASTPERYGTCPKFIRPIPRVMHVYTYRLFIAPLLGNFRSLARRREIRPIHYIHRIHRIHRRQHVSEDDAGISKHRLSPYNAYYHN